MRVHARVHRAHVNEKREGWGWVGEMSTERLAVEFWIPTLFWEDPARNWSRGSGTDFEPPAFGELKILRV